MTGGELIGGSITSTLEDAIECVGIGRAQAVLMLVCGITFMSDSAEIAFLSFVTDILECRWDLSPEKVSLVTSVVFLGQILGAPLWGVIMDSFGRRRAFLLSSLLIAVFGLATALAPGYAALLAIRSVVGFAVAGMPAACDLLSESLPSRNRGKTMVAIFGSFWTLGSLYVNLCAWLSLASLGWRVFTVLSALPSVIAFVLGCVYLPESPEWLLDQGRGEEARGLLNEWSEGNDAGVTFSQIVSSRTRERVGLRSFFGGRFAGLRLRRRAIAMAVVWFSFSVSYFGIVMLLPRILQHQPEAKEQESSVKTGAVGAGRACEVDFNFVSLGISSLAELFSVVVCLLSVDRIGRRWPQMGFYALCSFAALALGFESLGLTTLTIVASVGRFAANGGLLATWLHTPELFPVEVRGKLHCLMEAMSRLGGTVAPFLISDMFSQIACGCIMSSVSMAAVVAVSFLPETSTNISKGSLEEDSESFDEGDDSSE